MFALVAVETQSLGDSENQTMNRYRDNFSKLKNTSNEKEIMELIYN